MTQAEYRASLQSLLGGVTTPLDLPADLSVSGFVSIGASQIYVLEAAAEKYEAASRAAVAEVFGDAARWPSVVGCEPAADLSDACVATFVRSFGKRAYRRELSDTEVSRWVGVAHYAAVRGGDAREALSTVTSGLLQSVHFLYRVEKNALDPEDDRLKYDGRSMAVRLAFFLTGGPPSAELLVAGESGQLDTAEGVLAAAAPMLSEEAFVGQLTAFFQEYTRADLGSVEKSSALFPEFNDELKGSMQEGARLFFEKVVLAPGADVRSFFDSDQTFADAALAGVYGLTPPASGFAQFTLPPSSDRAGVMGQAAILAGQSAIDYSSPSRRGVFMLQAFFCEPIPEPPGIPDLTPVDSTLTTREKVEQQTNNPACSDCHALFDPMGFALEHFDTLGRYRETENGRPIDASGSFADGTQFNGGRELAAALRESATATECLLRHFYRRVNGRTDDVYDQVSIDGMLASLRARSHVLRDYIADFVVSDAFRSAPRVPASEGNE